MTEQNPPEWQASPPQEKIVAEPAQMSEVGTIAGIFIEPGKTFEDLKRKPRFIIAGILISLLVTAYAFGLAAKIGDTAMRTFIAEQVDKSPRADSMTSEQRSSAIDLQMTISKYSRFAVPVFIFISFFIGGLLYWAGAKAFGGTGTFMQNVAVWVYSGLPPAIVAMICNFIVMGLKSADEIDLINSQRGLLQANPSFFISGKEMPLLATFLSTFDVFAIWGWILAAIGLTYVNRISKASSWAIVIIIILIGLGFRVIGSLVSGNPA